MLRTCGHFFTLGKGRARNDHKGESLVRQDVNHIADAVETQWHRLLLSQTRKFATLESCCFVTVESSPAGWVSPLFEISEQQRIPGLWQVTGGFVSYGEKEAAPDRPHTSATPATFTQRSRGICFLHSHLSQTIPHRLSLFCLCHKSAFEEKWLTLEKKGPAQKSKRVLASHDRRGQERTYFTSSLLVERWPAKQTGVQRHFWSVYLWTPELLTFSPWKTSTFFHLLTTS